MPRPTDTKLAERIRTHRETTGDSYGKLAERFGVSRGTAWLVCNPDAREAQRGAVNRGREARRAAGLCEAAGCGNTVDRGVPFGSGGRHQAYCESCRARNAQASAAGRATRKADAKARQKAAARRAAAARQAAKTKPKAKPKPKPKAKPKPSRRRQK